MSESLYTTGRGLKRSGLWLIQLGFWLKDVDGIYRFVGSIFSSIYRFVLNNSVLLVSLLHDTCGSTFILFAIFNIDLDCLICES